MTAVPKRRCWLIMEGNIYDPQNRFSPDTRPFNPAGLSTAHEGKAVGPSLLGRPHRPWVGLFCRDTLAAIAGRHIEPEISRPLANPGNLVAVIAAPQEHGIPPCPLGRFAGSAGLQRRLRIGGLGNDAEISDRRECSMCLYSAGAR